MTDKPTQLALFREVTDIYLGSQGQPIGNEELYRRVAARLGLGRETLEARAPVGRTRQRHNLTKRQIRWHQQTLKHCGVLTRVQGKRGIWALSEPFRKGLHQPRRGVSLVAFSTNLGCAVWGHCETVLAGLDVPITLCVTSPPYPLAKPRDYGNPDQAAFTDFMLRALEPVVRHLAPGGAICLNLSNDIFEPASPARALYVERLLIALHDQLGLKLFERLVWHNPSKPPGPVHWASKRRVHLNTAYEPIYVLTNDPARIKADNRRVLERHTQRHLDLIRAGGEQRAASYADGAHVLRPGAFARQTTGRIPRNVLTRGHRCADTLRYRADATALALPIHGAIQPLSIPEFLIRFLSEEGDLVVDPFGGTATTGMAAERTGRRWIITELVIEYLRGAAERFRACAGFAMPIALARMSTGGVPQVAHSET